MFRILTTLLVGLATSALTMIPAAPPSDPSTHDGTVVSAGQGKLVMLDHAGKEMTHKVEPAIPIMIAGKAAKLEELKSGMIIRVTTDPKGAVASITTIDSVKQL